VDVHDLERCQQSSIDNHALAMAMAMSLVERGAVLLEQSQVLMGETVPACEASRQCDATPGRHREREAAAKSVWCLQTRPIYAEDVQVKGAIVYKAPVNQPRIGFRGQEFIACDV
jgi:hypothetical protein